MIKKLSILTILLALIPLGSRAQGHPDLSRFSATLVPGGVYLEWTIIAGQTCVGIDIMRLGEDGEFVTIGEIEGVCGEVETPESFSFLDTRPMQGEVNEYKLRLGRNGSTTNLPIFYLDFNGQEARVLQHIDGKQITIIPKEESAQTAEVSVVDMQGRVIDMFYLFSSGSTPHSIAEYTRGVYLLQIRRDGQLIFADRFVHY